MKSHASMNRIYRLVFNAALGIWVAVAENAKGRGKGGRAASALIAVLAIVSPSAYAANAADATVVVGTGSVATSGLTTTINQTSQRLAIDWTQLSTAANEALRFNQPNAQAIALNRIIGSSPSSFLGSLTANGQVFILNPNGILFGAGSQVNVGGLVASTLAMSNADFQAGRHVLTSSGGTGSVVNQGVMTAAQGGYLALLAPEVRNEGVMTASLGTALLAAGNKVTLNLDNGSLLGYSIDEKALNALVDNKQLIKADGGQVILSARAVDALSSGAVNNTGIVEAKSLTNVGGRILLEGDLVLQTGTLNASGTSGGAIEVNARAIIDAGTANASGTASHGGSIRYNATQAIVQTSAAHLSANGSANGGTISLNGGNSLYTSGTLSATGQSGGTVDLLGNRVVLASATVDASGTTDGGLIRVGGDFQGANPNIRNAQTTFVNGASTLKANGAGGRVAVWSDDKTDFYGNIIATGIATKGGFAEVSSKGTLTYGGHANLGVGGKLLLDPANIILDDTAGPAAFALQDPNAFAGKQFGNNLTLLGSTVGNTFTQNGKVVIASSTDNLGGVNAGAVYLFDTNTGALVSSLTGAGGNQVSSGGVTALTNGNYVVSSPAWDNGRGAATWGNGTTGISGVIDSSNSLVGGTVFDRVGSGGVTVLSSGNYLVRSLFNNRGAVTWGNGSSGRSGVIDSNNSLVGFGPNDFVGSGGITILSNGNYVVLSTLWDNGATADVGAVTWGSGTAGVSGVVSATNSLVGSTTSDQVGNGGITALSNGNYVVASANWNGFRGAATWGSGAAGVTGAVNAANSLVGSTAGDNVGNYGVTALSNGNYVVGSYSWNGSTGAATWGSGSTGIAGAVSTTNSLTGSTANDRVGFDITALSNGNYVVATTFWNGSRGAATWGSGSIGIAGAVSAANSLVGNTANDKVGLGGITALSNGNYVVRSRFWNGNTGAATWGSGSTGIAGIVSAANSLVGSTAGDQVGNYGITTLSNGNYVVSSPFWNSNRGAATWGNGSMGISGVIDPTNSLVGSAATDQVGSGGVTALSNGNYVVRSLFNGRGAVTWGNGSSGRTGLLGGSNSLVGSGFNDFVGGGGITLLSNGNYVVNSPDWGDFDHGAVTWVNGSTGFTRFGTNVVNSATSLIGDQVFDRIGQNGITALSNGNYVVATSGWHGGRGAATWGDGSAGAAGFITAANSLVGTAINDNVGNGGSTALSNGNYVVRSSFATLGAVTWGNGSSGITGVVGATNSLVGSAANDSVGSSGISALSNGDYLVRSGGFNANTGQVLVGLPGNIGAIGFTTGSGQTIRMNPSGIAATLAGGTAVTLQASNDITVNSNITVAGTAGGMLTLQAGRIINLNSVISTANGDFTASAGDPAATGPSRLPGAAAITQAPGSAINAGTGVVRLLVNGLPFRVALPSGNPSGDANALSATQIAQYNSALQSTRLEAERKSAKTRFEASPTQLQGCGVRMPDGFDATQCN